MIVALFVFGVGIGLKFGVSEIYSTPFMVKGILITFAMNNYNTNQKNIAQEHSF